MKQHRSVGLFSIVAGAICFVLAYDSYLATEKQVAEIAARLKEVEVSSNGIPTSALICSFLGVVLLVAGVVLVAGSISQRKQKNSTGGDQMLL